MDRSSILIWVALLLALVGTVLSLSWKSIFSLILAKELRLTPSSKVYSAWQKSPIPFTLNFFFFNCTNPEELMNEDFKPNLIEIGPYSFKEIVEKTNITWNANNTISFRRLRRWHFDAENSNGTTDDNITTLNPVALTAAYTVRHRNTLLQYTVSSALRVTGQEVWVTKSVGEFLYHGFSNPLLTVAAQMRHLSLTQFTGDKFAWFYKRNNSADQEGIYNVETGHDDISKIGLLRSWNFRNRTDFFDAECGQLNGSFGDLFPPDQRKDKPLQMFSAEFCKTITFDDIKDKEVLGIPAYVYMASKSLMDNGTMDPNNWCNCGGTCVPQGVLNVSACRYGAPGFVSYPHFLYADPYFSEKVKGMNPDPMKHESHITLEPVTGIPLDVAVRFQVNLLLQPAKYITLYYDMPTIFFPMFWFEETASIPPELAESLRLLLLLPAIGLYCSIGLLLLGIIILVFITLPKFLETVQRNLSQHRKGEQTVKSANQVVFSNDNIRLLASPATFADENPKITDATVK